MSNLETFNYGSANEPKPATNPEHLRIYGHMLWPFVQRSYFAFGAKKVPFQKVNVSLVEKAQWHLDFNGGFVPVLETPAGTMINESGFIAEFANSLAGPDQGLKLWPHEAAPLGDVEANMETG